MANGLKITPGQRTAARGSRTRKRIKDDDPRLLQLIGEIYRTVLEPERCPFLMA